MNNEPMPVRRFRRMTAALATLQCRTLTANELARNLGVSRRTVFRDLAVLRRCGFDILADATTQRLKLVSAPEGTIPFSVGERELLMLSIAVAVASGAIPSLAQINPLVSALAAEHNVGRTRRFAGVAEFFDVPGPREPVSERLLVGLVKSFLTRTAIRLRCSKLSGTEDCVTLFSPYRMQLTNGEWQVLGRSSLHRRVVTVPLSAIEGIEPTADRFSIPPRFTARGGEVEQESC